jgi:transcriptional regulator with XRE-family HTH domain
MTPEQRAARRVADKEAAASRLTVADSVGLALRAHRRRLGLSQRAYAAVRGRSASHIARLETGAGRYSLTDVVEALEDTGFALALVRQVESDPLGAEIVDPSSWPETELVARVRDGSRRFPAHHETQAVINPPNWWWHREFFVGLGPEPEWYAPRPPRPLPGQGDDLVG